MTRRRSFLAALATGTGAGLAACSVLGGQSGESTPEATSDDRAMESETRTEAGDATVPDGIESEPLPDSGDQQYLADVETFEHDDVSHVARETDLEYDRIPPTGGPHYSGTVVPEFHEKGRRLGDLVHNLEHGHVVVYYGPDAIPPAARDSLRRFVRNHEGDPWAAVVVVPDPREDPDSDYVLTAWGARLDVVGYDARVVRAFLAEYLGRGPENPVR